MKCCSGLIGRSWAMLFAAAGYQVYMYDVDRKRVDDAIADIGNQLKNLEKAGLLRGQLTVEEQHARVHAVDSLADCLSSAFYVQARGFRFFFYKQVFQT
jgi:L-gulonate 3-dehydrogenase